MSYEYVCVQVLVEAHTRALHDQEWIFAGLARFVMVARDNATGESSYLPGSSGAGYLKSVETSWEVPGGLLGLGI